MKKPLYLSKTLWVNLFMALFAMTVPAIKEFMQTNPEIVALIFTGVNAFIRLIWTDSKLILWDDEKSK